MLQTFKAIKNHLFVQDIDQNYITIWTQHGEGDMSTTFLDPHTNNDIRITVEMICDVFRYYDNNPHHLETF